jgi:hypothetical protein
VADLAAWLKGIHFEPRWLLFIALGLGGGLTAWDRVRADKANRARARAARTLDLLPVSEAEKATFRQTLRERPLTAATIERLFNIHRKTLAFANTAAVRRQIVRGELTQGLEAIHAGLLRQIEEIEDYRRSDPREIEHDQNLQAAKAALADIETLLA